MLKLVAAVALFAGFCWFGTQIPLGSQTLFGHLHAIAGTKESQDLFDGTKESAKPLVDDVRRRIAGAPDPTDVAKGQIKEKVADKLAEKAAERSEQAEDKAEKAAAAKNDGKAGKNDNKNDGKNDKAESKLAGAPHRGAPAHRDEEISTAERRRLRRLISSAEGASAPR